MTRFAESFESPLADARRPHRRSGLRHTAQIATFLLLSGSAAILPAAAQDSAPIPAEGQQVPKHAAGGWPTSVSGDDKKPKRTPEQQAALDEVAGELKRIATKFGPDSVVLQSKLLVRSMSAGASGATEVKVAGPSTGEAGPEHLEIDVETGVIFDEKTTTADSRRETILKDVAVPVLDEMVSFKIEPASLELVFLFDVQPVAAGETPTPSDDARHEAFRIRLSRQVLDDLVADKIVGDAMREHAVLTPAAEVVRPASLRR